MTFPEEVTSKLKSGRGTRATKSLSVIIFLKWHNGGEARDKICSITEKNPVSDRIPGELHLKKKKKAEATEHKTGIGSFLFKT